jgi:hypothetical protein
VTADEKRTEVVLHYRSGQTVRCWLLQEFTPGVSRVEAEAADGEVLQIPLQELKAVFFLKDVRRRRLEMHTGENSSGEPRGAKARVEFADGEIINGRVGHYSVDDLGFFLQPSAVESNNDRVFVVASALYSVDIDE